MTGFSARRLVTACAVTAASAAAVMIPAASASAETQIQGQGSTLQEFAQNKTFIPNFNLTKPGGEVKTYTGTGSGAGLEAWGNNSHKAEFNTWEYVGTDQPPNEAQQAAISAAAGGATVLSIPTLQAPVAIIVNLPATCTSAMNSDSKVPGRLVLNNQTLEKIFKGGVKWKEVKDDGDKLLPEGCEGEELIKRVVRLEGSGTTAITKKYLYQINQEPVDGAKTWNNLAEENKNLSWPEEGTVIRGEGSGGVVNEVAANPGSIGYVNTANAFSKFHEAGGTKFWVGVQDNGLVTTKGKYTLPEKPNKKPGLIGTANCKGDVYVNGAGHEFPPASTTEVWNEVSTFPIEKAYTLCGFTYDLSLDGFTSIEPKLQPSAAQITLIKKYFEYMIGTKTGAKLLKKETDYEGLPTNSNPLKSVQAIAEKGVEKIS